MMDLGTGQAGVLAALTLSQLVAMGVTYWTGRSVGWRRGNAYGYRTGYDLAEDKLEAELNETAARSNSAERLLRATTAELRLLKDNHARELRHAREALEAQVLELADAQALNARHATLLRQASGKFIYLAPKLEMLQLRDDARQCLTLANHLGDLADWLKRHAHTDTPGEAA